MATKRYVDVIQRALDEEIASLKRQKAPVSEQAFQEVAPTRSRSATPTEKEKADDQVASTGYGVYGGLADEDAVPPPAPPAQVAMLQSPAPPGARPVPSPAKKAAPSQAEMVAGLDVRLVRLTQVRDWISEDGDIARLIDGVIGRQIRASEVRQARLGVVLNVVFLIGGWALSLIGTPAVLGNLLGHH